jgi:CRP-like cAMP-binding protein
MAETDIKRGLQDFWGLLDDAQREVICNRAIVQSYNKGESLYKVGEESVYLVCVLTGHIKLEKLGVGGRMQITRMFCPGENFGYRSYFAKQDHQTEAVAMVPTQVALVPMELIEKICLVNAQLAMYFVRNLAADLGASDERTITLTQKHIRGRLAESITMLIEKYGYEADGMTINAALPREDLAALSNMTTSNAIRTLGSLVADGILEVEGRRIRLLNPEKLKHINANG